MNPFASYYVLVCIKQMFLYQEKYTSDDGRTLSKYVMCVIWKYLTNVCLFNKISQSDQTMKILLKLPARASADHKTCLLSINIADRSQAGPEMYAGSPDLTGFRGYFSSPFLVENTGENTRDQSKWIMIAGNKNKY